MWKFKIFCIHIFAHIVSMSLAKGVHPNASLATTHMLEDPEKVVHMVHQRLHEARRRMQSNFPCTTGNPIDDCWRCDPNWATNRQSLADCAIGYGRSAMGGKNGAYYVVTDPSDDDPINPKPGTLRYGVIQTEPLWIIFQSDMNIKLNEELLVNSFKTIDGRGVNVHIAEGACIILRYVSNVIIHGLSIHHCVPTRDSLVRDSPTHYGYRGTTDGDGISIFESRFIWVDHCSLSNCHDGLIDATMGSTAITISNNYFTNHDKVMLLGHSDDYPVDVIMQMTIAFNHFGEGLVQRMPRCRHGYFHVVNNDYRHWEMYAIGGSANPTINSEGNRFIAPDDPNKKEVTKRLEADEGEWAQWNWRSNGDMMVNGAYFTPSGADTIESYTLASSTGPMPVTFVESITANAGVLGVPREEDASSVMKGKIDVSSSTKIRALSIYQCLILSIVLIGLRRLHL